MPIDHDVLPDITRPDADTVLVVETQAMPADMFAELARDPWPAGLVSVSAFVDTDGGETALTYTQWSAGAVDRAFLRARTGAEPVEYRRYRSGTRENPPVPGCVVVVSVEFDGPDHQRQRRWVDTVFEALASETEPHPGGISAHFHASTDGTRVLNYAEWTDAQAHRDALANSGQGTVGSAPEWRKVIDFPGVADSGFQRYRLLRSLSSTPAPYDHAHA
ncbi:antibiotic biosynthesis monooxygenase [Actinophytocola sediminis]